MTRVHVIWICVCHRAIVMSMSLECHCCFVLMLLQLLHQHHQPEAGAVAAVAGAEVVRPGLAGLPHEIGSLRALAEQREPSGNQPGTGPAEPSRFLGWFPDGSRMVPEHPVVSGQGPEGPNFVR